MTYVQHAFFPCKPGVSPTPFEWQTLGFYEIIMDQVLTKHIYYKQYRFQLSNENKNHGWLLGCPWYLVNGL